MSCSYEGFKKIVNECKCSNTYKMAWAKSIVECLVEEEYIDSDKTWNLISILNLVEKMIKYYWNFEVSGAINQGEKNCGEPIIVQCVKELIDSYKIEYQVSTVKLYDEVENKLLTPSLFRVYENVVKKSLKAVMENVSWRFGRLQNFVFNDYICTPTDNFLKIKKQLSVELVVKRNEIMAIIDNRWNELLNKFNKELHLDTDYVGRILSVNEDNTSSLNEKLIADEKFQTSLNNVKMSNRLRNSLKKKKIKTVYELIGLSYADLSSIKNIGKKTLSEALSLQKQVVDNFDKVIIDRSKNLSSFDEFTISEELIDKLYSNELISSCRLSVRTKNALLQNDIETIADLIKKPLKDIKLFKNLGKKSLDELIDFRCSLNDENNFINGNPKFVLRVIRALVDEDEISIIKLKNYLQNNTKYPTDKLSFDIQLLRESNDIIFTMNGIKLRKIRLIEYIGNLNQDIKFLLLDRFSGMTLQQLGDMRNLTRERVRQKIMKAVNNIPQIEEDKYKDLFIEYEFNQKEFTNIFNEEKEVYFYLKEKYKMGNNNLINALNDDRLNETQKSVIRRFNKIIKLFGETIELNRLNVIRCLVKEYAVTSIFVSTFTEIYNSFCNNNPSFELNEIDERSMEGILSRADFALFGIGKKFRYYNIYEVCDTYELLELKRIFTTMDTGYYSMLVIYRNNKDLMATLNLLNEYELHNFSRHHFNGLERLSFDRMPNFSVNGISKNDFFEGKIKEFSPISVSDFCRIMELDYGHKEATLSTYITNEFFKYVDCGFLKYVNKVISDEEVKIIKDMLTKDIYSIDEIKDLLRCSGFCQVDDIITSFNMYKVGYRIRSGYIMRKDISSIEDYFRNLAYCNDFIANENILKNSTYSTMMKRNERNLDIFLISHDEYITIKKLNSLGITKEDIIFFCNQVYENFNNEEYFTLSNVREVIDIVKLDDFGFDDIFFENIIGNMENISYAKFSNNRVYSFVNSNLDSKKFVLDCIGTRTSVLLDELQNEIETKFGINVNPDKIKSAVMNTDLFFSNELNKIYQNKNFYYEEVYYYG